MANILKVYGVPISVHTRKVIVAARIKAIPYEIVPVVPVNPATLPPNWGSLSPTGLIPVIDDAGFVLADSTAIALYLERKVPQHPLLPADLRAYGKALSLDAWAGSELFRHVVQPLFHHQIVHPRIREQPGDQAAIDAALHTAAPQAFAHLERELDGMFLVGDALSLADLAVISNLLVFHYLGHRIAAERFPKLAAYFERHLRAPVLAETLAAEEPIAAGMQLDTSFLA